jgi:hypothetical protein
MLLEIQWLIVEGPIITQPHEMHQSDAWDVANAMPCMRAKKQNRVQLDHRRRLGAIGAVCLPFDFSVLDCRNNINTGIEITNTNITGITITKGSKCQQSITTR